MHSQLTLNAAQQRIADLHRAAEHNRLAHSATTAKRVPVLRNLAWQRLRREAPVTVPRRGF
jgi:hypothetical protein